MDGLDARIFWTLRLPRAILGWCAGATLGVVGAVFQSTFRNRLADPSLLGVSSGAALGAAAAIRFGAAATSATLLGGVSLSAAAFVGALVVSGAISIFARRARSGASVVLAGVAVSSVCSSLIMVFQFTSGASDTFKLVSWTMGGVYAIGTAEGLIALPAIIIALAYASARSTELDLITFGDEAASSRGVDTRSFRIGALVVMSIALAIVVSRCGPIGSLGLISPHAARRAVGHRHLPLAFASAAVGGAALVVCDTIARTIWSPLDIPVGIVISFVGAPFFLWLLIKEGK